MLQSNSQFHDPSLPMLGICAAASGMGKTTLLESLLPALAARGVQVAIIKQARADFDLDRPGKDSHRMRQAGAAQVLVSSPDRWVLMTELADQGQDNEGSNLAELACQFDPDMTDLVLVEGYRNAPIPKIEVFRASQGKPLLAVADAHIIAVACDTPVPVTVPRLDLNQPEIVADFISGWLAARQRRAARTLQAPWRASA